MAATANVVCIMYVYVRHTFGMQLNFCDVIATLKLKTAPLRRAHVSKCTNLDGGRGLQEYLLSWQSDS